MTSGILSATSHYNTRKFSNYYLPIWRFTSHVFLYPKLNHLRINAREATSYTFLKKKLQNNFTKSPKYFPFDERFINNIQTKSAQLYSYSDLHRWNIIANPMCPCENVEGAHDFVGGYFCVSKRYSLISNHLYMVYYVFNIIDVHVYYNCYECLCEICNVCIRERTIYVFRICASFWHVCIGQWNMIHLIVSMSPITKHSKFLFLGIWIISMAQSHSPQEKKLRQRWWKHGIYILSNVIMLVYYNLQKNDSLFSVDLS